MPTIPAGQKSAFDLIELMRRTAPESLDLLTANTPTDFENAVEAILEKAIAHLEANSGNFKELDEVGLSAVLIAKLGIPGIQAHQEKHSNGHVDITIEIPYRTPMFKMLGEAKIYMGSQYHINGVNQLFSRYTTGREARGMMIVYVKKADIAGKMQSIRERMDADLPNAQQGGTIDHSIRWSFLSKHVHSSGETIEIGHYGCNLFSE